MSPPQHQICYTSNLCSLCSSSRVVAKRCCGYPAFPPAAAGRSRGADRGGKWRCVFISVISLYISNISYFSLIYLVSSLASNSSFIQNKLTLHKKATLSNLVTCSISVNTQFADYFDSITQPAIWIRIIQFLIKFIYIVFIKTRDTERF